MVEYGARVLVLEREKRFKDRVRGEGMFPWGGTEMQALGIYQLIVQDPTRVPDHLNCGPDLPLDETLRRRFSGED